MEGRGVICGKGRKLDGIEGRGAGRGGQWRDVMSKYAGRSTSKYPDLDDATER